MAPIVTLSCKESFIISHSLERFVNDTWFTLKSYWNFKRNFFHSPNLSSTANSKEYGVCYNLAEHSHEYIVEVIICGMIDNSIGTVMSVSDLKWHLRKIVVHKLNGKNLNTDVDFFRSKVSFIKKIHQKFGRDYK